MFADPHSTSPARQPLPSHSACLLSVYHAQLTIINNHRLAMDINLLRGQNATLELGPSPQTEESDVVIRINPLLLQAREYRVSSTADRPVLALHDEPDGRGLARIDGVRVSR